MGEGLRAARTRRSRCGLIPVADGGDGTVDAAVAAGFERRPGAGAGPVGEPTAASFAVRRRPPWWNWPRPAACVGCRGGCSTRSAPQLRRGRGDPGRAGRGRAHDRARRRRQRRAPTAGAGLLAALGARFLGGGRPPGVEACGAAWPTWRAWTCPALDRAARRTELMLAADVDNPLLGPNGAAAVYGPQKGAAPRRTSRWRPGSGRLGDVLDAAARRARGRGGARSRRGRGRRRGLRRPRRARREPAAGHRGWCWTRRLRRPARTARTS